MKLLKHSFYNMLGLGLPLLVAIVTIPLLIQHLGEARFGLLTLVWAITSYFGLFDFGLGRALTQQLAVAFLKKNYQEGGPLVATASGLMGILGVLAAAIMAMGAPWGVEWIQDAPDKREVILAVYASALAVPFVVLTSGFRGVLEARHAFGIINFIRFPMGVFTFLGPLAVVMLGEPRLDYIAWTLAIGRVIACAAHAYYAWSVLPHGSGSLAWRAALVKPLLVSGSWLTVSNIISPFMGYVDRFMIGSIVSASAVAYYVTPQELVTKLWIIPGAFTAVLFPTFAAQLAQHGADTWALFKKATHWLFVALLPITVGLSLFAPELLSIWVGSEFAAQSAPILQIFSIGIFLNCLAHVPFTLIQSGARAKLTALVHCAELPFFLVALWWLTTNHGIFGAALAWLLRMSVDTMLMFALSAPLLRRSVKQLINFELLGFSLLAATAFAGLLLQSLEMRIWWVLGSATLAATTILISRIRADRERR